MLFYPAFLIGLAAGLFGGLIGLGGGAAHDPPDGAFFKFSQHQGTAISLMALGRFNLASAVTDFPSSLALQEFGGSPRHQPLAGRPSAMLLAGVVALCHPEQASPLDIRAVALKHGLLPS